MELKFFTMLAEIVRAFPPEYEAQLEIKCRRPQAFAVLQALDDLDTDNLRKSSNRYSSAGYFFSHRFNDGGQDISKLSYDYPLFAIAHQPFTFNLDRGTYRHQYNIAVFDQLQPGGAIDASQYCAARTFEEQARDMHRIMRLVLEQAGKWFLAYNDDTNDSIFLAPGSTLPDGYREISEVSTLILTRQINAQYIPQAYSDYVNGVFATIEVDFTYCQDGQVWQYPAPVETMLNQDCESC